MRTFVSALLVVVIALTLGLAVSAQDTGQTTAQGDIACDADLMLNLFVANRFFGFHQFQTDLADRGVDPAQIVDLNRFNRGQFDPLFQGVESMQGETGMGLPFTEEQRTAILDILALDEATFQTEFRNRVPMTGDAGTIIELAPGVMAGEAPECAHLRSSLNRFWTALAIEDFSTGMMLGMDQGGVTGTGEVGDEAETGAAGEMAPVNVSLVEHQIDMPASIPAGTVTFNITNNGTEEHSFEIEGNGIEEGLGANLQPGESGTLTVDLAPGTFTVYCPVGDHRAQGMELQLTVTEAEQGTTGGETGAAGAEATATPAS